MSPFRSIGSSAAMIGVAAIVLLLGLTVPAMTATATGNGWGQPHPHLDCSDNTRGVCAEVAAPLQRWGHYVGHDEPSVLFYSNQAGSGNQMVYQGVLPKEPPATAIPGKRSFDFMLYPAIWYGMAMCATQSYPETVNTCVPDSDVNVTAPGSPYHAGTAYMELQFYPPGYVSQWNGFSCSATQWCAALTIDSYGLNPVTGQQLNSTCASQVGLEYANFAYLTHTGVPQGPPNPVQFTPAASGVPNPHKVLFLNQGDHYTLTMHDTQHGLQTIVDDTTTGQSGSMTASAANGFGQVKFAPTGTNCVNIPYDFHPMYSTSRPATIVPWTAATYNIAFDTELGHFQYCSQSKPSINGVCVGTEGAPPNVGPADSDDYGCFNANQSTLIKVGGCEAANLGYDGPSYLPDWPNGNRFLTPTPTLFTSPLTGPAYDINYSQVAFNTDLPAIEGQIGQCNIHTGTGCSLFPTTDSGTPTAFYPYYTIGNALGGCAWAPGQDVPGFTTANFGKNSQYGQLLKVTMTTVGGGTTKIYQDFNGVLQGNPCPAHA